MFCPTCGKQHINTEHHPEDESCDVFLSITKWLDRDDMTLHPVKNNDIHTCSDCKTIFVIGEPD